MTTSQVDNRGQFNTTQPQTTGNVARFARRNGLQIGIIGVLIVMWLFFLIAAPETFLAPEIYAAFMQTIPLFGIMALPLTMLIIAREIDLSFTSIMAIGMVAFLQVWQWTGSPILGLIACLLTGLAAGALNGLIIVRLGIPSLIATIGTQFLWRGAVNIITNGRSGVLTELRDTPFREILVGKIADYVPMQFLWMIVIAIIVWLILNRHKFGAHVYLIGDNENSARLMGVSADRTRIALFAIMGLTAAFAGLVTSLNISTFWPTLGEGYLLQTLAAVFLGGTSVFGGVGSILGTFVGSFIIGAINAGIVAAGLGGFWTEFIYGLIIIISVWMHGVLRRRLG
jgi:simple sugar transport system permease protein